MTARHAGKKFVVISIWAGMTTEVTSESVKPLATAPQAGAGFVNRSSLRLVQKGRDGFFARAFFLLHVKRQAGAVVDLIGFADELLQRAVRGDVVLVVDTDHPLPGTLHPELRPAVH